MGHTDYRPLFPGLDKDNTESARNFMWNNFFQHVDIQSENVHILDGNADDLDQECEAYEAKIKDAGGIELFVAGNAPLPSSTDQLPLSRLLCRTQQRMIGETGASCYNFHSNSIFHKNMQARDFFLT